MKSIQVDHGIPLFEPGMVTVHVCPRESELSNTIIRKFRSKCGNTLEVHVTRKSGFIRTIKPLDTCQANCVSCAERVALIRELIARERSIH